MVSVACSKICSQMKVNQHDKYTKQIAKALGKAKYINLPVGCLTSSWKRGTVQRKWPYVVILVKLEMCEEKQLEGKIAYKIYYTQDIIMEMLLKQVAIGSTA